MALEVCAHCDWSKHNGKRWMSTAIRADGKWLIAAPELVGDTATLFRRLAGRSQQSGSLLVGFDFPIGLPKAYAAHAGIASFREAIAQFGKGDWSDWYDVADQRHQISHRRPFYPMRPGGTARAHLYDALGILRSDDLLRECERATPYRPAGCSLFWTLGGNQVGKGAISGWQEIIAPALDQIGIWPFDGVLAELTSSRSVVICETYPADVYSLFGMKKGWGSKRRQEDRQRVGLGILEWAKERQDIETTAIVDCLRDGFGADKSGEDRFDAVVGLLGMLEVATGRRPEGSPDSDSVKRVEGWILGHHR
ncbi:DUF429 domain-containing protein [Rhizobium tumorigenes]|nr:DUF429 domain-containing protein [Rhizobium tumorigenes]WFS02365.1 DUF429 domain-containing protein [Rhizobium tumorigenes]